MKVKCHYCGKKFDHYGVYKKALWCSSKCQDNDRKIKKQIKADV